jgi:hypothetical protein
VTLVKHKYRHERRSVTRFFLDGCAATQRGKHTKIIPFLIALLALGSLTCCLPHAVAAAAFAALHSTLAHASDLALQVSNFFRRLDERRAQRAPSPPATIVTTNSTPPAPGPATASPKETWRAYQRSIRNL